MGSWRRGQLRVLSRRRKAMRERHALPAQDAEGASGRFIKTLVSQVQTWLFSAHAASFS
jgi:hypothetical protein